MAENVIGFCLLFLYIFIFVLLFVTMSVVASPTNCILFDIFDFICNMFHKDKEKYNHNDDHHFVLFRKMYPHPDRSFKKLSGNSYFIYKEYKRLSPKENNMDESFFTNIGSLIMEIPFRCHKKIDFYKFSLFLETFFNTTNKIVMNSDIAYHVNECEADADYSSNNTAAIYLYIQFIDKLSELFNAFPDKRKLVKEHKEDFFCLIKRCYPVEISIRDNDNKDDLSNDYSESLDHLQNCLSI